MVKHHHKLNSAQTYSIAHSAHCKLSMVAGEPDRNLRFVLGHAFTLDKALLRVAEIEEMDEIEPQMAKDALQNDPDAERQANGKEKQIGQSGSLARGNVAFDEDPAGSVNQRAKKVEKGVKQPKPPTSAKPVDNDTIETDSDEADEPISSDVDEDADADDDGLGLTRFASASAEPPRMIPSSESDSDEEDEGPESPPSLPADFNVHAIIDGPADAELGEMYELVSSCPCHGHKCEKSKKIWEVKDPSIVGPGKSKKRLAIMEVAA